MNDRRRSTAAAASVTLAVIAAAWGWAAWALARIFTGHCIDGPCRRGDGDHAFAYIQAAVAVVGVAACVVAVLTGIAYAARRAQPDHHLRSRVAAVAVLGLWIVCVVVGRLLLPGG